jgi:RNA polymerase sigma-70 factor (ECF subfamily)
VQKDDTPGQATLEALGELYERSYHRFLRVAEAVVGDPDSAHDAVQEAFARAVRGRASFRGTGPIEGWVWRTVVNAARSARRDRPPQHLPLHEITDDPAASNGSSSGSGPDGDLRAHVAALPERQRLVLFLRYYADLDYQRIAEVLEIKPGTVGATLNQAHASLRRQLKEKGTA